MTKQNTQAEKISDQPKLTPNFRHRLWSDDATSVNLVDSVLTLANQAENIIVMVQDQFIEEGKEDRSRLADKVIFHSLDAVYGLVNDIKVIVNAYHVANQETKVSQ